MHIPRFHFIGNDVSYGSLLRIILRNFMLLNLLNWAFVSRNQKDNRIDVNNRNEGGPQIPVLG